MVADFVENDERQPIRSEPGMQCQASVDRHQLLVCEPEGLGIDDREIQLQLERQIRECLAKISDQPRQ